MNTIFLTTQIVCYGVGIVSASLNIASFVRRRRVRRRRVRARKNAFARADMDYKDPVTQIARCPW